MGRDQSAGIGSLAKASPSSAGGHLRAGEQRGWALTGKRMQVNVGVPSEFAEVDHHERAVSQRMTTSNARTIGHLEKFLSPSRCESESLTARGNGRMEEASHGAEGLFRC